MTRTTRSPTRLPFHTAPEAYHPGNEQQFRQGLDDRVSELERVVDTHQTELDGIPVTTTRGDIIRRGASEDERLAIGTSGYALISDGTDPAWTGFLQSGTGAATRVWQTKLRETLSVTDFGALGDGSNDDTAEIQAAIDEAIARGGAVVYFPSGTYKVSSGLTITGSGVTMRGAGMWATTLQAASTTGDLITSTGQHNCIEDLYISGANVKATAGYAINLGSGSFQSAVRRVRVGYMYGGIYASDVSSIDYDHVQFRYMLGPNGGCYITGTNGNGTFGLRANKIDADNPYPHGEPVVKTWATTTAYSLGDIVKVNGSIWQCSTAGTSAGAGTGPSAVPGTNGANVFTTATTDGTAAWKWVSSATLQWFTVDNYAYSVSLTHAALLNGNKGISVVDTAASGSSYPIWFNADNVEIDHPYENGITLTRGEGFYCSQGWLGSSLAARGILIDTNYRGEVSICDGTRIVGNALDGVLLQAGPKQVKITGCDIALNSQSSSGTYHGINVSANSLNFIVANNHIGRVASGSGSQGYGIFIAAGTSNYYTITGNVLDGNATGGISDGGTGTSKEVQAGLAGDEEWTTYVPTYSAVSGTITTMTTNRARYKRVGKHVTVTIDVTVTDAGTGAGALKITLPVTAASSSYCGGVCGREMASVGTVLYGVINTTNGMYVQTGAAANPIVTGYQLAILATYEAA
jgi:hypothetical protein